MVSQGPSSRYDQSSEWRDAYEAALKETNTFALFKCVEIAEAPVLTRLSALRHGSGDPRPGHHPEQREIEKALENLRALKRDRLRFG